MDHLKDKIIKKKSFYNCTAMTSVWFPSLIVSHCKYLRPCNTDNRTWWMIMKWLWPHHSATMAFACRD